MDLQPVILSGGSGTRLWPLSRRAYPKQFLSLVDDSSLLQSTAARTDSLADTAELLPPLVVCNEAHRFLVAEQLRASGHEARNIILEPVGRNTAPALTLAALDAEQEDAYSGVVVHRLSAWTFVQWIGREIHQRMRSI